MGTLQVALAGNVVNCVPAPPGPLTKEAEAGTRVDVHCFSNVPPTPVSGLDTVRRSTIMSWVTVAVDAGMSMRANAYIESDVPSCVAEVVFGSTFSMTRVKM